MTGVALGFGCVRNSCTVRPSFSRLFARLRVWSVVLAACALSGGARSHLSTLALEEHKLVGSESPRCLCVHVFCSLDVARSFRLPPSPCPATAC